MLCVTVRRVASSSPSVGGCSRARYRGSLGLPRPAENDRLAKIRCRLSASEVWFLRAPKAPYWPENPWRTARERWQDRRLLSIARDNDRFPVSTHSDSSKRQTRNWLRSRAIASKPYRPGTASRVFHAKNSFSRSGCRCRQGQPAVDDLAPAWPDGRPEVGEVPSF
jgi:hypothetical protein